MTTQELIEQSELRLLKARDRLTHCSEAAAKYNLIELSILIYKELVPRSTEPTWTPEKLN